MTLSYRRSPANVIGRVLMKGLSGNLCAASTMVLITMLFFMPGLLFAMARPANHCRTGTNDHNGFIYVTDKRAYKEHSARDFNLSNSVSASNTGLSVLALSSGTLSPVFAATTFVYTANVANAVTSITITASVLNQGAIMTVNGSPTNSGVTSAPITMNVGKNIITVKVTEPGGVMTNTYTVTVMRAQSPNANLAAMSISRGILSPSFKSGTSSYAASVKIVKKDHVIYSIGDSITANGSYPDALDSLLNNTFTTVNFGVSGEQTAEMVERFPAVISASPDYVTFLLGVSDILGSGATAAQVESSLQAMYTSAHNAGIKVVALTLTPSKGNNLWTSDKQAIMDSVNVWMPTAANVDYVIDTFAALEDPANPYQLLPAYDSGDHAHPNTAGQDVIAEVIYSGVKFIPNIAVDQQNAADTSFTVTPVTSNVNATVSINGKPVISGSASAPIPLSVGINNVPVNVTAPDKTLKTYTITVTGTPSTNADLANLYLKSGIAGRHVSPFFSADSTIYRVSVGYDTTAVPIRATTIDNTATIKINGMTVVSGAFSPAVPLNLGQNVINTVVTAQDGITTKTYTMMVTRRLSANSLLTAITISPFAQKTLVPGPGYLNYTASVANSVASVALTAITQDTTATITINGTSVKSGSPSASIALSVGANVITTVVTAQDGTTKSYIITTNRTGSGNALLIALTITPSTPETLVSGPGYANYTASVANAISSVTITPTTADPTATVKVNGATVTSGSPSAAIALSVGANVITTIVTAQDGTTTKSYTITITRAPSNNALLNALAITPSTPKTVVSGPGYVNYTASVANAVTSVKITPVTQDATATVKVNGTTVASGTASGSIALVIGSNTINTVVTAQDGTTTKSYIITITRANGPIPGTMPDAAIAVANPANNTQFGEDGILVHRGLSPNGDGINDFLQIDNIAQYPDNKLMIMNRNGNLVYEAKGYDNNTKVFDGHSNKSGQMQMPGTYFYLLEYTVKGVTRHKTGYIVLKY